MSGRQVRGGISLGGSAAFGNFVSSCVRNIGGAVSSLRSVLDNVSCGRTAHTCVSLVFRVSRFFPSLGRHFLRGEGGRLNV